MSIQSRLIFISLAIVLSFTVLMYYYLAGVIEEGMDEQIVTSLAAQANLAREFLKDRLPIPLDYTVDALVDRLGTVANIRLTLIGRNGVVYGDTERNGQPLQQLDNHAGRPEVRDALSGKAGLSNRKSATVRTTMRYYAIPVSRDDEIYAVCRVAMPVDQIQSAVNQLKQKLMIVSVLTIGVAAGLIFLDTRLVARPVRQLTGAAEHIAAGVYTTRVTIKTPGKLGRLASSFNQMAARIQAQIHEISHERDRLNAILAGMSEGVLLIDRTQLTITEANPSATAMLKLPDHYQGRGLIEAIRDPALQLLLDKVPSRCSSAMAEIALAGNSVQIAQATLVAISEAEYLLVLHDITRLRQLEQMRVDFVANVSHELRTPLTSIQGYAETLLEGALNDPNVNEQFLARIEQQAKQLSQLISDLLDLSHLESGDVELHCVPIHIMRFREPLMELFEQAIGAGQLELAWDIPDDLPDVPMDQQLIQQVLTNLVDNAVKYTPAGGKIRVSAEIMGNELLVHVADTGIGIASDILPRVFERFYRADKDRSRELGGTGLGLSIAKHILLQHHGRIWADSTLGRGSVFHFALPLMA